MNKLKRIAEKIVGVTRFFLDKIKIGGFELGFWFAQQGSIIIFVLLIVVYCFLMNRLDKKFEVSED